MLPNESSLYAAFKAKEMLEMTEAWRPSAVGHNPISIIIPCHRVVGSNGSLTGSAGGVAMKVKLLEFVPKKGTAL